MTKEFDASALITMQFLMAAIARNMRDPVYSRDLAYVSASVNDPRRDEALSHTHLVFCGFRVL